MEEAGDIHASTVGIREAVKRGTISREAKMRVLPVHEIESKDAEVRRGRLHHLILMLIEDLTSDKIRQTRAKKRPTDQAPEDEDGAEANSNHQ
jgi:hypothetical protein